MLESTVPLLPPPLLRAAAPVPQHPLRVSRNDKGRGPHVRWRFRVVWLANNNVHSLCSAPLSARGGRALRPAACALPLSGVKGPCTDSAQVSSWHCSKRFGSSFSTSFNLPTSSRFAYRVTLSVEMWHSAVGKQSLGRRCSQTLLKRLHPIECKCFRNRTRGVKPVDSMPHMVAADAIARWHHKNRSPLPASLLYRPLKETSEGSESTGHADASMRGGELQSERVCGEHQGSMTSLQ